MIIACGQLSLLGRYVSTLERRACGGFHVIVMGGNSASKAYR